MSNRLPINRTEPLRPSHIGGANAARVLKAIRDNGPISRAQAARLTHLSPTAISGIVSGLLEQGLVIEEGPGLARMGRRPILLRFNPAAALVGAVDVDLDRISVGLLDLSGQTIACHRRPLPEDTSADTVVGLIRDLLHHCCCEVHGRADARMVGLGLVVPSSIEYKTGMLTSSLLPGLANTPLRQLLEEELKVPVFLENDAKASALAEFRLLAKRGVTNFVYLKVSEGIGAGLILNGILHRGSNGVAGNIGHVLLPGGKRQCNCGNQGCLEAEVGGKALLQRYGTGRAFPPKTGAPTRMALDELVQAVAQGDHLAIKLVEECGRCCGQVLATVTRVLDVDEVVVGGILGQTGEVLLAPLREAIRRAAPKGTNPLPVSASRITENPGVVAAGSLVLDAFFASPLMFDSRDSIEASGQ